MAKGNNNLLHGSAVGAASLAVSLFYGFPVFKSMVISLLVAYLPSYFDRSELTAEGRYWPWFAEHPLWKKIFAWFPGSIQYEAPLSAEKQYIFGSHPHGVMSLHHAMLAANATEKKDDQGLPEGGFYQVSPGKSRRDLGASVVFRIPFYRDLLLWLGVVDASRTVAKKVLKSGKSLLILVGGEQEQLRSQVGEHTVFIKDRKGFVKLALEHGTSIVPAYTFGETDLYYNSTFLYGLRMWLMKNFRVAITFSSFIPNKVPLVTCFGRPIEVPRVENPTKEQINEYHQKYIDELARVFEKNKAQHGHGDKKLTIL